jgi:hypothetical protein
MSKIEGKFLFHFLLSSHTIKKIGDGKKPAFVTIGTCLSFSFDISCT